MKKTILFLSFVALFTVDATAQDTLASLPSNYFGTSGANSFLLSYPFNIWATNSVDYCDNVTGFYTPSPIVVYGIAVSFICPDYYNRDWMNIPFNVAQHEDTTFDYTYEYARLYSYDKDNCELSVIDERMVHIENTPISHWINAVYNHDCEMDHIPVYELYFEKGSYTVQDTFYLGVTTETFRKNNLGVYHTSFMGLTVVYNDEPIYDTMLLFGTDACTKYRPIGSYHEYAIIFPILTPNPNHTEDTTTTDTTAINSVDASLQDGLLLTPNPAHNEARVTCSHTMQTVTLFAADGTAVLTLHPDAAVATLDLRPLPAGVYTLVATTAAGSAARILIVE